MKIQLVRIDKEGKQKPIRIFSHSEEIIIQRTRVRVIDRNTGNVSAMYVLEGLGPTGWVTIETTGNQELFAYVYVGDEVTSNSLLMI
ncbi:MAG: hypothetical protein KC483_07425 [Nitrosarchaeum sp.]|nr:hypothetical protein [Nitrosarchaeum sp.]MCA9819492.1 hypothetical protein [Nitrosarchaeum sp.]